MLIVDNHQSEIVASVDLHTDETSQVVASFVHNEITYDCYPNSGDLKFYPRVFNFCLPQSDLVSKFSQGVQSDAEVKLLQEKFGACEIRVYTPNWLIVIARVLITPFYCF